MQHHNYDTNISVKRMSSLLSSDEKNEEVKSNSIYDANLESDRNNEQPDSKNDAVYLGLIIFGSVVFALGKTYNVQNTIKAYHSWKTFVCISGLILLIQANQVNMFCGFPLIRHTKKHCVYIQSSCRTRHSANTNIKTKHKLHITLPIYVRVQKETVIFIFLSKL